MRGEGRKKVQSVEGKRKHESNVWEGCVKRRRRKEESWREVMRRILGQEWKGEE